MASPFTAKLQIPQEEVRCDCKSLASHLYSPHTLLSNLYCRKCQFILHKVFFLLIAVNYVEINCLIICYFHKWCHIRNTISTFGLLPTLPLQRSRGDAAESFMGVEVLWVPELRRRHKDNGFFFFCFYVFVFLRFLFRVCQVAVRRVENKQTPFPWGSIWAAPGESYIFGCLGNVENWIPSVIQ